MGRASSFHSYWQAPQLTPANGQYYYTRSKLIIFYYGYFHRLRRGDQILKVNDTDIAQATHEEAARVAI